MADRRGGAWAGTASTLKARKALQAIRSQCEAGVREAGVPEAGVRLSS